MTVTVTLCRERLMNVCTIYLAASRQSQSVQNPHRFQVPGTIGPHLGSRGVGSWWGGGRTASVQSCHLASPYAS